MTPPLYREDSVYNALMIPTQGRFEMIIMPAFPGKEDEIGEIKWFLQ